MRCADTSGRFASSGLSAKLYEEGCFAGTTSDFSVFAPSSQSERKWLSLEQIRESEIVESDNVAELIVGQQRVSSQNCQRQIWRSDRSTTTGMYR